MAGGKSTKRVNLRTKIAKRNKNVDHTGTEEALLRTGHDNSTVTAPEAASSPSLAAAARQLHTPPPRQSLTSDADRQAALHIRDALRQRRGRTARAPAMKASSSSSSTTTTAAATAAAAAAATAGAASRVSQRKRAKKESTSASASQHPAARRRAAVLERRRLMLPAMSAAEARMAVAQQELQLFDKVQTVAAYTADPFSAVLQHLSATMDALQPQTSDVGRAERTISANHRH
ncbi:hypothetical protein NESM_000868900 [Novymonas esmeraldas]|uniref:Ribosome biogenesis protein SLX9 n=1 Tax=Novymonas esmeraldas TaxID=1808958 RepID=A0AAW0EZR2_9TRYP